MIDTTLGIIIIILAVSQLVMRWKIKQLEDKMRDANTWEHNSPARPGYITDSNTGKMRSLTNEEKEGYSRR